MKRLDLNFIKKHLYHMKYDISVFYAEFFIYFSEKRNLLRFDKSCSGCGVKPHGFYLFKMLDNIKLRDKI